MLFFLHHLGTLCHQGVKLPVNKDVNVKGLASQYANQQTHEAVRLPLEVHLLHLKPWYEIKTNDYVATKVGVKLFM